MKRDRLRHNADEIHTLDDLIEAREENAPHYPGDRDSLEQDVDLPEDLDIEEALTFPHPKRKKAQTVELMSSRDESDLDEDWDNQDIQPSDYEHNYEEGTDAYADDDEDSVAQEKVHAMGEVEADVMIGRQTTELPEKHWKPDEETTA
jgi:hypothetical protein